MNVFAFAPFSWWPLCLVSSGVLFALWLRANRMTAARLGFAYGLGMFGVGTSWMYVSLNTFGGMSPLLAGFCIVLLVLAVSLWFAAAGFVQACFSTHARTARLILIMPAVWLQMEWLRGWMFTGFPWLSIGYAMTDTPAAGFAPLGGVYLVGLFTLMSAGALLALLLAISRPQVVYARQVFYGHALLSLLLGLGWLGGWYLSGIPWSAAHGSAISVAIVQNNVPLTRKWASAEGNAIIADYLAISAPLRTANLVVWPEAAVPGFLDSMPANFQRQLRAHPADFIFGVLTRTQIAGEWRYFNSIATSANPNSNQVYHKQHLVPFGEFLPVKWLFAPLMQHLDIPMSDFTPWRQPQNPLRAAGNSFAASVCYEDAFPAEWRNQVPTSGMLVNLSEDAWFGDSLAPHQRLQMARHRALESARPMIRASNNGLSSVINWRGEIEVIAPQFVKTVVTATVQPRIGVTPYTQYGDIPALLLMLLIGGVGVIFGSKKHPSQP